MPGIAAIETPGDDARTVNARRERLRLMVAEIGPVAAALVETPCEGRVVAVFARSAYLDLGGRMLCVGVPEMGRGPLNALVGSRRRLAAWLACTVPGERVTGVPQRLRIGGLELGFDGAQHWHPPRPALPVDRGRLARGVAQMRSVAAGRIPGEGLGFLVTGGSPSNPLAPAGHAAACALTEWLTSGTPRVPTEAARPLADLIGLGPGLTPSGDDFLGGALVALHALGAHAAAGALAARLLALCVGRTHPISVAHLRAAASGLGGEALHACLCAIAEARDPGACLDAIAGTGHTSGWDALAGVVTVAAAT